ncbi:FHA domain-containing protein [Corynebacterium frankenforstense]|uniref:FHA domain-containing protein FhaB/FipA n=1 Tax=Corynebacterium TaxID=1716 RepID=UPI00254B61E0|nr:MULTISPECIES: FHA domain-containing protein [Corynebacterium]MDK6259576.1 FHA domain-containing protein [Corynebacterium frankenforstense]MDK8896305.1 FHA domain-containing protein [Corynebacterium sp. MSK006]
MDSLVLTGFRIGLLVLLWLFIFLALRAMRRDTAAVAGGAARNGAGRKRTRGSRGQGPRAQAHRIAIVEGPLKGSHMELTGVSDIVLGRNNQCDFVLGDDFASGRHARLFRRGSDWFIEDLDSRNGTYVAGVRIDQPERVGTDTDIRVGRTTVRLVP